MTDRTDLDTLTREELQETILMLAETLRNIVVATTGLAEWKGTAADAVEVMNRKFLAINARLQELEYIVATAAKTEDE